MKIPQELSFVMMAFHEELHRWIANGGDKRLIEFSPLDAWGQVVNMMAEDGNTFECSCPECVAKRAAH